VLASIAGIYRHRVTSHLVECDCVARFEAKVMKKSLAKNVMKFHPRADIRKASPFQV